ncbi:MAG TPA: hypothetical protein VH589_19265 [Trebonia sp.]|jgi:hypothetical protein
MLKHGPDQVRTLREVPVQRSHSDAGQVGVTSAIIGPHTMDQLDDLLASAEVTLTDEILDQIDEIVPPGTDAGQLDQAYLPPAMLNSSLRRRPDSERSAA